MTLDQYTFQFKIRFKKRKEKKGNCYPHPGTP